MASRFSDNFNRFTTAKQWERLIFRASHGGLQSAELNELQDVLSDRMERLGRGIYQDGHVVEGCNLTVLPEMANPVGGNPTIQIDAGRIALRGTVYDTELTTLEVSNTVIAWLGIRFHTIEQDEFDDTSLLNPAIGTRGYMEAGAGRLKAEWTWGWKADDGTEDANSTWDFYPVYEVDHGVFVIRTVPPGNDPLLNLLAKYDREAHGNYVVRGFGVTFVEQRDDTTPSTYVFDVGAGLADIQGFKVERRPDTRMTWDKDPTLVAVTAEPHTYNGLPSPPGHPPPPPAFAQIPSPLCPGPDVPAGRAETIFLNRSPIALVSQVTGVLYKEVQMTKGVANGTDTLPDATVLNVLRVVQTTTCYNVTTDYTVSGDVIDWSPGGSEPAVGSTYVVGYTYEAVITPTEIGPDHIVVDGLFPNTQILVDYSWALPRKDLIVLNADGSLERLIGVSQIRNPSPPRPADDQVALSTVEYTWIDDPKVEDISPHAVPMTTLNRMKDHIFDLYELVAIMALRGDQGLQTEQNRLGIFVDPFTTDDNRDFGIDQKAAIDGVSLQLPVPSAPYTPDGTTEDSFWTLGYTLEEGASQLAKTGCLAIVPIFVEPPPIIHPPPPPPPVPRTRHFSITGWGDNGTRPNAVSDALGPATNQGALWYMNYRVRYNPPLDAATKTNVESVLAALVDTGSAGTYWGDSTPGVPNANHNRSGVMTIGGKDYTWFTRIEEMIFTNPPLNLHHWTTVFPPPDSIYEWTGAIPSDAVINAKILDIQTPSVTYVKSQIDSWAGWGSSTKTAMKADVDAIVATALLKNQVRHTNYNINGNRYDFYWANAFQPNHHWNGTAWVHRLSTVLNAGGPRDETEPNVSAIFRTTVIVGGTYVIDPSQDRRPPRRRIHTLPPTLPTNTPPVQPPPQEPEETFAPDGPLRFTATGFKPQETIANAVVDGETLAIMPRTDFDNQSTTDTNDVDVS